MTDLPALVDSGLDALSAIAVALIAAGVLGVRSRVKSVQAQVENDHTTNMREEQDERHKENSSLLRSVVRDIGGIRQDLRDLRSEVRHERDRIDEIEDTINPKERP